MTRKNVLLYVCMLITAPLIAGCWDIMEPQRMYYINAIGVDYEDNQYKVYLQIINFADVAKSEQPSTGAMPSEIGSAEGRTIEEAIYKLYRSVDQEIFWGHLRFLLLSERVMEHEHSLSVIDTFIRVRETRYQIWVYCTKDPIKDVLLVTPILQSSLTSSKLSNPIGTTEQESFIEPKSLRNLVIGLNEPSHEVSIPYVSLTSSWENVDEPVQETTFAGVGILSKDGFKGFIQNTAARGNQWMFDKTSRGEITFKLHEQQRDYLTVDLDKLKVKVKPIVRSNESVTFNIDLHVQATLNGFKESVNSDEIRAHIQETVKKEIIETYEEGLKLDVDIYRFSEYLYRANLKTWKTLEKDGKIPLTKDSIGKITIHVTKINPGRKTYEETIEK